MVDLRVYLWDKISPINGVSPERLREKFVDENGTEDRVIFEYGGAISRIQYADDKEFDKVEKNYMQTLISGGKDRSSAICETWAYKLKNDEERSTEQARLNPEVDIQQLRADLDFVLMMGGLNL